MRMRTISRLLGITELAFALLVPTFAVSQDLQRGFRNYQDILNGRKKLEQLSPQEKQEVFIIHGRLRASRASGKSPDCRDALEGAESAASDLASYARRLQYCAEGEDYSDDCSTEFSQVRNAHSEYENAVSDVSSECD